jgi:hypothetical protein
MNGTPEEYRDERPPEYTPGVTGTAIPPPPQSQGPAPVYRAPSPPVQPKLPRKSPGMAVFLSFVFPGLGQIYIGYYQRGFTHAMIAASLIATLVAVGEHSGGLAALLGISLGFFYFYNIIDAGRRASLYNLALESGRTPEMPEEPKLRGGGSLTGGVILIALGLLIFLNTMFDFSLEWLADWWPLGLVILGVWMVYSARKARRQNP